MWQDLLIMSVQWVFAVALLAVILNKTQKPPLWSSIFTSIGLFAIAFALGTLELWLATISATVNAIEWGIIAYQRYHLNKRETQD